MIIKSCIFDLDGVITDTAHHHYLSWQHIAKKIGGDLTESENEGLKGVSRKESLEKILEWNQVRLTDTEKEELLQLKNEIYLDRIQELSPDDILPGVLPFLDNLTSNSILLGIGSSSKNAPFILKKLNLFDRFDAISDGRTVELTKPHPDVFLAAAKMLNVDPKNCVVFEDATSGVEAGLAAGMKVIGIGDQDQLASAHAVLPNMVNFTYQKLKAIIS